MPRAPKPVDAVGDDLATAGGPAFAALLRRGSGSRDGRFGRVHLTTVQGEACRVRAEVALLQPVGDGAAGDLIVRLRALRQGARGFSVLNAKVDELHEEVRRRRETEAQLRALVDTAVDGVMLIDSAGTVLMFNPACERLFDYAGEEVIGRNVRMLMPEPDRSAHDGYIASYLATGERRIIGIGREVEGRRKDGSTFPMDLSVGEAKQQGGSIFVGIIHDLTERKRTEAQLVQAQKMETVGQLSGGVAHDFNNLLTVILGNADLLAERLKARPDLESLARSILRAGERGAELTQRLLAFSRRQTLQPRQIDVNALIGNVRDLLRRTLPEDIAIVLRLADDLPAAFADPAQLESALLNLALNARDAMPDGGGITFATADALLSSDYSDAHPEVPPGSYVTVSVTDDGEGMPSEVTARAFEPFFTTKEVGKGSGLGLSMVYGFVKQSNGHVSLYSEPGLGTTVRLYLPAIGEAVEPVGAGSPQDMEFISTRTGETVLVVEDDPFVRSYAVACLESLGYRTIAAADGHDAIQVIEGDGHIDLLFSDIVMPGGMNGWELVERARRRRPDLKSLLTSGYAIEALTARGRLLPGRAFLNKPYRKAELARQVRAVLDRPAT